MKAPFYKSVGYALEGIKNCFVQERNIKIHICFMILVIVCGFVFSISYYEWIVCILLFGFVIALELVNTAIETVVNLCHPMLHPLAKLAKDVAAGAVLVSAVTAVVIGCLIFIPKIFSSF